MLMRLHRPWSALALAAAALVATVGVLAIAGRTLEYSWLGPPALVRVTGEFLCGAALCRALMLRPGTNRGTGGWPPSWAPDALGYLAIAGYLVGTSIGLPDLLLVTLLALAILGGAQSEGSLTRVLGRGPIAWLGEISYSIYMVHLPILIVARRVYDSWGYATWSVAGRQLAFIGAMATVIGVAALMYYVVERPARQRLRNKMGIIVAR